MRAPSSVSDVASSCASGKRARNAIITVVLPTRFAKQRAPSNGASSFDACCTPMLERGISQSLANDTNWPNAPHSTRLRATAV
jgi:hypothetical protein